MNSYIINESELRYELKDRSSPLEYLTKKLFKKDFFKKYYCYKRKVGSQDI